MNFASAKAQLDSLRKSKLNKDSYIDSKYKEVIETYKQQGFIEKTTLETNTGHFLPHHPVIKDSKTTPVRMVLNASSKMCTGAVIVPRATATVFLYSFYFISASADSIVCNLHLLDDIIYFLSRHICFAM